MTDVVIVGGDGSEEWAEWSDVSDRHAYAAGAQVIVRDSDPARVVGDFRRDLPGRVWQSPHGQEIRVFMAGPNDWQWTVAGMDVTDYEAHPSEESAREQAHACTDRPEGNYADFPLWGTP
jgi:hypothetical protein